jgi:hypothetical protein
MVTAFGTGSSVVLAWRGEKRESAEFRLKIEQLQLELATERANSARHPHSN